MVLILDGGLGTALEGRGINLTGDDLWSARLLRDDPETLVQVHKEFYDAGANIVTSSSYQFSFEGFGKQGVSKEDAEQLLRRSVQLIQKARDLSSIPNKESLFVAASLGTYGAVLADGSEYTGRIDKTEAQLVEFHYERLVALLSDPTIQPDYVAFESVPTIIEVRAICTAVKDYCNNVGKLPIVWLSLSCSSVSTLNGGDSIVGAIEEIESCKGINIFGFNCLKPTLITGILKLIEEKCTITKDVVLYPNRGEVYEDREWKEGTGCSSADLVTLSKEWLKTSEHVKIIGGCCRTTVGCIKSLSSSLNN
uniref:Hcy-binding domain-containing protein n=1 Tax=Mucochytrium quahogii TaxID=96639 RepID=A0A7S2S4Q4_9STRA|mmetsp:Transcript_9738/g.15967  ORF Transcript_9738/g.15967 Transcript_9738/m.15967 type:complete len:309 (+) Transcript_9738:260-1186(+)|eukprot:CAMPEP_0203756890 /NCGR_PEP_ID=MMETSP0098-20131031/10088_1 /ASSEMBLY_ACC=CAM_ASM_000208 /TAXON_ID=96639 /ORGANISM=" , Strain NY0313808BC1" /LENGTH=308 /DNA_ID=CAMNT_0050648939 /DNA_START=248 /DNA_END=1174 /DNA_ORIENTATION=+